MGNFTYSFRAKIIEHDFGRMSLAVVEVPASIRKDLPLADYPRLRIRGQINEMPHKGALQSKSKSKSKWYVMLPKRVLKACRAKIGDRVTVGFEIDDQDAVDVPAELVSALEQDEVASKIWNNLTSGKQRGFAYMVDSAKRIETRERRAQEVLRALHEL